ncbi:MAG: crotonase/enoyl-CoA hydratase family protein [Candidatus Symbiobacter sp.]|nr:crotonase/enoyl-CoA hydratase family protein [Candidatus Symbiobacter sp.]
MASKTEYNTITVNADSRGVVTVTFARPDKHNALNAEMIGELERAFTALAADARCRVIVLAASGKSFCGGADLGWMQAQMTKDRAGKMADARALAMMLQRIDSAPQPVLGRVQGSSFGGGVGMMSVCDWVAADERAMFGLTEVRLGIIPATISPYVIRRLGEGAARRVFMNGRKFSAHEAQVLGLVARVTNNEAELDAAMAGEIAAYLECAPGAVAAAKQLCLKVARAKGDADLIDYTIGRLADIWESEEAKDGIAAFFAKTTPPWRGS